MCENDNCWIRYVIIITVKGAPNFFGLRPTNCRIKLSAWMQNYANYCLSTMHQMILECHQSNILRMMPRCCHNKESGTIWSRSKGLAFTKHGIHPTMMGIWVHFTTHIGSRFIFAHNGYCIIVICILYVLRFLVNVHCTADFRINFN